MYKTLAMKLVVPAAFFGYAAAANIALLNMPDVLPPTTEGMLSGEMTQALDGLYRDHLPHKEPAVGIVGAIRYVLLDEGRKGVVIGRHGVLFTAEEFRRPDDGTYAAALDRVTQTARALESRGIDLVVAALPAKIDLLRTEAPDPVPARLLDALQRRFIRDLMAAGIAVVDARPALAGLDTPFIPTDTHWTPEGATAVAFAIAESGYVAAGGTAYTVNTEEPFSLPGDLVSFVTTDAFAPALGLLPVEIEPYRAVALDDDTPVADIFGFDSGGIDLVGTSYSANPNWSFAEALKLALNRDVVNHAQEGRGPFAPMAAYLDRLDPVALPETVIWEIPIRYLTAPGLLSEEVAG